MDHRHAEPGFVGRARRGDQQAWASLYRSAYPRLIAFAHRRLRAHDLACDAVSETMTRAVAAIDTYVGEDAGFTPWLFGICRHVVADMQRVLYRQLPERLLRHEPDLPGPVEVVNRNGRARSLGR